MLYHLCLSAFNFTICTDVILICLSISTLLLTPEQQISLPGFSVRFQVTALEKSISQIIISQSDFPSNHHLKFPFSLFHPPYPGLWIKIRISHKDTDLFIVMYVKTNSF